MSAKKHRTIMDLTPEETAEAKESLRRYFEIGWRIATRLHTENPEKFEAAAQQAREFDLLTPKQRRELRTQKTQLLPNKKSSTSSTGVRKTRKVTKQKPLA